MTINTNTVTKVVFTETIRQYIEANAGMFASEAEAYIPGIVAALLAALDAHKLQVIYRPTTPPAT